VTRTRSSSPPASSAGSSAALARLEARIVRCRACPRLVAHREDVARTRVARFRAWTYWGRPVPGFGDPAARLLVVGLAPAAARSATCTAQTSGQWTGATCNGGDVVWSCTPTCADDFVIGNGDGSHRSSGHGMGPCMLHNPSYDFNDDLIPLGATMWVRLAEAWLAEPQG